MVVSLMASAMATTHMSSRRNSLITNSSSLLSFNTQSTDLPSFTAARTTIYCSAAAANYALFRRLSHRLRFSSSGGSTNCRRFRVIAMADSPKAAESGQRTKPNSLLCVDCDGNGMKVCHKCEGNGINAIDHFNGRFKAGGLCWLCRGKKEILCGNCNGAGFVGGYLSTHDD